MLTAFFYLQALPIGYNRLSGKAFTSFCGELFYFCKVYLLGFN